MRYDFHIIHDQDADPDKRDDSIDCIPPLKDTSNLSPRQILKFNIKADPNLYGNVPT